MDSYTVFYETPNGAKHRTSIVAFDKADAKKTVENLVRVDNNSLFDCKILRIRKHLPPTAKQQLARKYGFLVGSIKSAQTQFILAFPLLQQTDEHFKVTGAISLVNKQFAKLQRDLRDTFQLAGLKVKP